MKRQIYLIKYLWAHVLALYLAYFSTLLDAPTQIISTMSAFFIGSQFLIVFTLFSWIIKTDNIPHALYHYARSVYFSCLFIVITFPSYFAAYYMHYGLRDMSDGGKTIYPSLEEGLYFSYITFTTVGYGDFAPAPGAARYVTMFEALSGYFLLALSIVSVQTILSKTRVHSQRV